MPFNIVSAINPLVFGAQIRLLFITILWLHRTISSTFQLINTRDYFRVQISRRTGTYSYYDIRIMQIERVSAIESCYGLCDYF